MTGSLLRHQYAAGVRIAPFQLLATDGANYHDRDHGWHLGLADRLVAADPDLFLTTRRLPVRADDPGSVAAGVAPVGGADRRRRRGHGGQADGQPDPRP